MLVKRDIGYGQGPGQAIPYRLDIYAPAAAALGVTKNPGRDRARPLLGHRRPPRPAPASATPDDRTRRGCADARSPRTAADSPPARPPRILADGRAAAPAARPRRGEARDRRRQPDHRHGPTSPAAAVHGAPLSELAAAYDCSGATSYLLLRRRPVRRLRADLRAARVLRGQPGPGRWITVYANSRHVFIDVAGIAS